MLIEFSVGNFRSFKEPVTLSMVAAKIHSRDRQIDENNTIQIDDNLTLLTSAGVYGANASGKSNLISAMAFMHQAVLSSATGSQAGEPINISRFRLSTETEHKPAFFQVVFLLDGQQYRYGFEIDQQKVVSEWLFYVPARRETKLFIRDEHGIHLFRSFKEGRGLEEKTRPNALFLSVDAQFNGAIAIKILGWFRRLNVISGLNDTLYGVFTVKKFADGELRDGIIRLVKDLDLGIGDIFSEKIEKSKVSLPKEMPDDLKKLLVNSLGDELVSIKTVHKKWDAQGQPVGAEVFDLGLQESEGTKKLFSMAGPILDTLAGGKVLFVDEMEARLHPLMTQALISLFNSLASNPKRAQLVFTTHDTNLLSKKLFRRDQIWFIEKDHFGSSHLYSLAELKVRNDASFENDYIEGRYGAIPFIGDVRHIVIDQE